MKGRSGPSSEMGWELQSQPSTLPFLMTHVKNGAGKKVFSKIFCFPGETAVFQVITKVVFFLIALQLSQAGWIVLQCKHQCCPYCSYLEGTEWRALGFLSHEQVFPRFWLTHIQKATTVFSWYSLPQLLSWTCVMDVKSQLGWDRHVYTLTCWRRGWLTGWLPGQCQVVLTQTNPFPSHKWPITGNWIDLHFIYCHHLLLCSVRDWWLLPVFAIHPDLKEYYKALWRDAITELWAVGQINSWLQCRIYGRWFLKSHNQLF